jgi:hypothetical protein
MKEVGRLDFLETILQTFTIDSEGQRVAISSAEIYWGTLRTTTEKVGFFGGRRGSASFAIYGAMVIVGLFAATKRVFTKFGARGALVMTNAVLL